MDSNSLLQYLVTALVSSIGIGWFLRSAITHVMNRDLARYKADLEADHNGALEAYRKSQEKALQEEREAHESSLEAFRKHQDKLLQDQRETHETKLQRLQKETGEGLEELKAGFVRIERLETEILKNRGEAYRQIWTLTGNLNLFGPTSPPDCDKLSTDLSTWYFSGGETLTKDSKRLYFLAQELLNFCRLRGVVPSRPSDEVLYGEETRTVAAMQAYRMQLLAIPIKDAEADYQFDELEQYVRSFKAKCKKSPEPIPPEEAWLLLQLVMSTFRSRATKELGSTVAVRSEPEIQGNVVPDVSSNRAQHSC